MGDDDTAPEPPTPDLLFDEFLTDSYRLFVLVSAFGVLGVYLFSVRERGIHGDDLVALLDIAIVASLTLVVIVSSYINFLFVFIYTDGLTTPTAAFSTKNAFLAVFLVPFDVLIVALVVLLARIERLVPFVVGLVSFVGGILLYGLVSPRIFGVFKRRAESEGYGSFLGLVAFGGYNVLLFAGASLALAELVGPFGVDGLLGVSSSGAATTALLSFVVGIAVMPVVMVLGLVLFVLYYRIL